MTPTRDTTELPVGTIIETDGRTLRIHGRTTYAALQDAVGFRPPYSYWLHEPFYVGHQVSGRQNVQSNGLLAACRPLFGDVDIAVWCGVNIGYPITVVRLPVPNDNEVDE